MKETNAICVEYPVYCKKAGQFYLKFRKRKYMYLVLHIFYTYLILPQYSTYFHSLTLSFMLHPTSYLCYQSHGLPNCLFVKSNNYLR
jgi:hypothetical protein